MSNRERQKIMRGEAIQRVLARQMDRAAISSLDDLRRAYEKELTRHGTEIAAHADGVLAKTREIDRRILSQQLRCAVCGGAMEAKRVSRRTCSPRCRQRAYRQAWAT